MSAGTERYGRPEGHPKDEGGKKMDRFYPGQKTTEVSERELKKICKGATVVPGLAIHGAEAAQSESKVSAWAKKNV